MGVRPRRRRRTATKRRVRRWVRRQDPLTRRLLVAVTVLAVLVVALIAARPARDRREPVARVAPPPAGSAPLAARRARSRAPAVERTWPAAAAPAQPKTPTPAASHTSPRSPVDHPLAPRLAIVIDDLGQSLAHLEQVAGLDLPLTIAVIPGLPATARTVREARRRGIEMLLHQPMEPREEGGKNPGDGVLLTSMSAETLRDRLRASLAAVPAAVGVNNHMGSRFTEDAAALEAVMAELAERNLFWLDSRTTPSTRGPEVARGLGVPEIERDIFIDAQTDPAFIRGQLRKLVETARLHGAAVGIGHPHPETLAALRELRGELLASGVTLVPVSALARPTAAAALVSSVPRAAGAVGGRRDPGSPQR